MKKIALIFYLLFSFSSFAQETDFFTKLKYTDLIFYQKEYTFDIRIKGENPENYTGNFKISSNDYEATNCILNSSKHSKDIKRAKELLQKMILISYLFLKLIRIECFDNPCRISDNYGIIRYIFCNYRASSHDGVCSYAKR